MDLKKTLLITTIVLALFCCMSVASAGWFDFFGGNETYTFDGFTLDMPSGAYITNMSMGDANFDYSKTHYEVDYNNTTAPSNEHYVEVTVSDEESYNDTPSVDEFVQYWEGIGGVNEGTYGDWTIININNAVETTVIGSTTITVYKSGYILVKKTDSRFIYLEGNDLNTLKNIVDTYKET